MEIKQNIFVHNRYDIEVRDAASGELKQEAVGYNVVCDGYFRLLLDGDAQTLFKYIAFGSGSGTPAITDAALFTQIARIAPTDIETIYAYPTSHRTVQIILDADSYNGSTITEVGIWGADTTYVGDPTYLISHAMIQDSEGQQIAITKTNTDVVYITATFYVSYTQGGFGNNGIYPTPGNNELVKFALGTGWTSYTNSTYIKAWHHQLTQSNQLNAKYTFNKKISFRALGDTSAKTLSIAASILSEEGGTQSYRCVGFPGIGAFNFPDSSVLERYAITSKTIGTGDGTTTDFCLGVPFIKAGTVHVYVDDTEKTEGTDFTIDYDSNDTDNYGNYHSGTLSLFDNPTQVVWGNSATQPTKGYTEYDPVAMWPNKYVSSTYTRYGYITQENPIWLDFLTGKECNVMKIMDTIDSAQLDNMVIEYSSDNENWTAVTYTRAEQVYKWPIVTARYWRVYISGYSWKYDFAYKTSRTLDGVGSIYTTFFLGKSVPALHFTTAPAEGSIVTASYDIEVPYKTENNLIRMTVLITLNRD